MEATYNKWINYCNMQLNAIHTSKCHSKIKIKYPHIQQNYCQCKKF